ncbi:enoyl-CoA hydratase/isomerase family protein [Arundinibacter roseus]|uniref:Enoyl-CoA hydratase/isomerase family protein n=1 Tax=Arundinibacter roseus TaxID=2070510 RepID=A0A4R4JTD7_9BACT|nr:enoyl-CoA hydratase/isomerase family protein [Arundinibacter roseus]TDB57362.1 enoyl-CoA hydratase/isomerase family protein [Arundinibacter roseus]
MEEGFVRTSTDQAVSTIEFFHPAGNSLPLVLLQQLATAIQKAGQAPATAVIILKSSGERTFCGGASLAELLRVETLEEGKIFFSGFAQVINAMRTCPKFVIARVQGKAVGGGVGLLAATDYCLATQQAAVKLSELSIGLGPFVIEPAVSRRIGKAACTHLTINASEFESAIWAWRCGLYDDVYETIMELDQAVHELAQKLATYDPNAMRLMKEVLWQDAGHWDELLSERAVISGTLALSEPCKKALAAFRKPSE